MLIGQRSWDLAKMICAIILLSLTKSTPPNNNKICSKVVKNSSKPVQVDRSNEYKPSPLHPVKFDKINPMNSKTKGMALLLKQIM
jgi:hypothetical protein